MSNGRCPTCNEPWDDHALKFPKPICPPKDKK